MKGRPHASDSSSEASKGLTVGSSIHSHIDDLHQLRAKTLIECLPGIYFHYNQDLELIDWNQTFVDAVGTSHDDAPNHITEKSVHEADHETLRQGIENVFTHGHSTYVLRVNNRKTGEYKPYFFSVKKIDSVDQDEKSQGIIGVGIDISEILKVETSLRQETAFLQAITETSLDGMVVIDAEGQVLFYNDRYVKQWRLSEKLLKDGSAHARRTHMRKLTDDPEHFTKEVQRFTENSKHTFRSEIRLLSDEIFDCYSAPVLDGDGTQLGRLLTYRDITAHRSAEQQRNYLAMHDKITGLLNRSAVLGHIERTINMTERPNNGFALIAIDILRFKRINDLYGHAFGDRILSQIADRLYHAAGKNLLAARHGDDEFLIFVPHAAPRELQQLAQSIIDDLAEIKVVDGLEVETQARAGVSIYPEHGTTATELIARADIALEQAKKLGRGKIAFYSPEFGLETVQRSQLELKLPAALEQKQFSLVYQPFIDVETQHISGCEALLRWHSEDLGSVAPTLFLPYAEESELIVEIGEWVLREACTQAQAWVNEGLGKIPVSVNVSGVQFSRSDIVQTVAEVLKDTGLDPNLLFLELTETTLIDNLSVVSAAIDELRALGVRIAIDDFGTGYSSLMYLKHFRVDTLKIDQSFVQSIGHTPGDDAIVQTTISIAHTLGLDALAEGVETPEQLDFLHANKCDNAQGYLFSKPISAEDITQFFAQGKVL